MGISGGPGDEVIGGSPGPDSLGGGEGGDVVSGGDGDDSMFDEDSRRDELHGGAGTDVITGGPGDVLDPGPDIDDVTADACPRSVLRCSSRRASGRSGSRASCAWCG